MTDQDIKGVQAATLLEVARYLKEQGEAEYAAIITIFRLVGWKDESTRYRQGYSKGLVKAAGDIMDMRQKIMRMGEEK